jgi:hypothetical protein
MAAVRLDGTPVPPEARPTPVAGVVRAPGRFTPAHPSPVVVPTAVSI